MALKHTARFVSNKRKVVVAYKVVPDEPENCIVVTTENLMADEHDALMKLVESSAGQEANDLATAMARARLPDGRNMLAAFHTTGKMIKMPTSQIEMTPDRNTTILLSELNEIIAAQQGVSVADLAVRDANASTKQNKASPKEEVPVVSTEPVHLDPNDLAAEMRSKADAMFKEAKKLRELAEELSPTKKKTAKTEESA